MSEMHECKCGFAGNQFPLPKLWIITVFLPGIFSGEQNPLLYKFQGGASVWGGGAESQIIRMT